MESFLYLKLKYSLNSEGYTCGVLWAAIGGKRTTESHYAYVYWKKEKDLAPSGEPTMPEFISISPTFDSRDGEYRKRFIKYETFLAAYDIYGEELSLFEDAIWKLIIEEKLSLNLTFFPYDEALAREYKHSRLLLKVFAYSLALDLWEYYTGLLMEHTNSKYKKIILLIGNDHPELINLSKKLILDASNKLTLYFQDSSFITEVRCGQKIVPLYHNEVMNIGDYNLPTWKETNVMSLVSDLVLNFITPSFPLYNDWTYIFDSDLTLFENTPMHNKYALSDVISYTLNDIRKAREKISEDVGNSNERAIMGGGSDDSNEDNNENNNENNNDDIFKPNLGLKIITTEEHEEYRKDFMKSIVDNGIDESYNSREFNAHLYEDIEYAQSHLVMSDISLLHIVEDVGWTLHSVNNYITKALKHPPVIRNLMGNWKVINHYIFNYIYAAHCMHTKMHVVHSDIHSNNLTLHLWGEIAEDEDYDHVYNFEDSFDKFYEAATVVYATGYKDEEIFLFPATGINAAIIDFSRVLLGPNFRPHLESDGRGPQYATNFYRDQVNKVMAALNRYAPAFVEKHQEPIKAAIIANFQLIFPVLCCIDCMAIGGCLINFFENMLQIIEEDKKRIEKDKKIIEKDNSIEKKHGGKKDKKCKNEKKTIFDIAKSTKIKSAKLKSTKTAKVKSLKTPKMDDKFVPIPLLSSDNTELFENKIKDIKKALKLSQDIESKGRELLIKGLAAIIDFISKDLEKVEHSENIETSKIFEHPTRTIIDIFFKEFSFSESKDGNLNLDIVDGYNYNNDLKYSNTRYKKYPPWANLSLIEKNLHGYKMQQIFPFGIENFLHNEGKKKIYTATKAEELIAQSKKLDGEPMYTASSWIEK